VFLRGSLSIGPFEVTRWRGGRGSLWEMLLVLMRLRGGLRSAQGALRVLWNAMIAIHSWEGHPNRADIAGFNLTIQHPDTRILVTPERTCRRKWNQAKKCQRRRPAQQIVDGSARQ
jgi:hypothetical protein